MPETPINFDDAKQVTEELKKQGISSLDDLIKQGLEEHKKRVATGGGHDDRVFKSPTNNVFWW